MLYWQAKGAKVHMMFFGNVWYISGGELPISFDSLRG
jgi:hypothetical protein